MQKAMTSIADIKKMLSYSPATGEFVWLRPLGYFAKPGDIAGYIDAKGYVVIGLFGAKHKAHRLAWAFVHGEMPTRHLDHKNGNRADNRICNLRLATPAENMRNVPVRCTTKSGIKGVARRGNKWIARARINGVETYLGIYETAHEAGAAYRNAASVAHGEFFRM